MTTVRGGLLLDEEDALLVAPAARPLWLMTLADLALLLVGFLVLVQASAHRLDGATLARGLRLSFATASERALPVAATAVAFAPGSAAIGRLSPALVGWAHDALQDPRVAITVTGATAVGDTDVDRATRSAAVLAADRARTVVVALAAAGIDPTRLSIATAPPAGTRRAATLTLAFAGEQHSAPEQP